MSIIGPRPALWNQYDLIAERDKYGANDVPVGLTGLAQINGRDIISIEDKARYDGMYAAQISLMMDIKCFIKTILCVLKREGIIEGGNIAPNTEDMIASKNLVASNDTLEY